MSTPNFDELFALHAVCRRAAVAWTLHYSEADNSWALSLTSAAPSEDLHQKRGSLEEQVEEAIQHLRRLGY
jgi:hypothetical protein